MYTLETLQKSQHELTQRIERGFANPPKPVPDVQLGLPTKTFDEFLQLEDKLKEDTAACEKLVRV